MCTHEIRQQRLLLADHLRAALSALESNDDGALQIALDDIVASDERPLALGVAKLASDVRDAIRALDVDSRIKGLAGSVTNGDMRDACDHLDHVVRMTEAAAHRTLDLVDDSRDAIRSIGDAPGMEAIDAPVSRLRANMQALAMAQEYQDLSGQLIRRVISLVRNVEGALVDLLALTRGSCRDAAQNDAALKDAANPPMTQRVVVPGELLGPAAEHSSSQQDADALLADLGF